MLKKQRKMSVTAVAAVVAAMLSMSAVAVVALVLGRAGFLNPLSTTDQERSHTAVLAELRNAHHYVAATGRFTTVVDVEHKADHVPSMIKGDRAILIAEGDVDASVDFGALAESGIETDPKGHVTVHLPAAQVGDVRLDHDKTYVADRQRGVLDRVAGAVTDGNPNDDQPLYQKAGDQLRAAAQGSELRDRAKHNTETFVRSTLGAVGQHDVTVVFDPSPADRT